MTHPPHAQCLCGSVVTTKNRETHQCAYTDVAALRHTVTLQMGRGHSQPLEQPVLAVCCDWPLNITDALCPPYPKN